MYLWNFIQQDKRRLLLITIKTGVVKKVALLSSLLRVQLQFFGSAPRNILFNFKDISSRKERQFPLPRRAQDKWNEGYLIYSKIGRNIISVFPQFRASVGSKPLKINILKLKTKIFNFTQTHKTVVITF